jgi:pilus assembly protein Flp/PilA
VGSRNYLADTPNRRPGAADCRIRPSSKSYTFSNICGPISAGRSVIWRADDDAKLDALYRLIKDDRGVTAIEYGLIAALIAVAAVVIMGTVGTNLSGTFSQVASNL